MYSNREFLEGLFAKGVHRCLPAAALPPYIPSSKPLGNTIVLGAGKAACEMAAVVYDMLGDDIRGAVVTRYGHGADSNTGPIECLHANHPVPDENGVIASKRIMEYANTATADDRVICLISGGGSSLLTLPVESIGLSEMAKITDCLVKSGAPISDINCVRRHLSQVKGGRLANAVYPAQLHTFAISDVVGDSPADIASGPTVAAAHEPERVLKILDDAGYPVSETVKRVVLENHAKPVADSSYHVIARAQDALTIIEKTLLDDGWEVVQLGEDLTGDATETALKHADIIERQLGNTRKVAFTSGGELTVDVKNHNGAGGPNLEYLAALVGALPSGAAFEALACDSDGIDGARDNAGGYVNGDTLKKVEEQSLDLANVLASNTTYQLFEKIDQLIVTGPTGTNVNDIRIILLNGYSQSEPL